MNAVAVTRFGQTFPSLKSNIMINIIYQVIENITRIVYYVKSRTILYNYWYFVMATRFAFSLDHIKVNFHKLRCIISAYYVLWVPYYDMICDIVGDRCSTVVKVL